MNEADKPNSDRKEVVLANYVRCFEMFLPGRLTPNGYYLQPGKKVLVGEKLTMWLDHRPRQAVPFICDDQEGFLLVSELTAGADADGARESALRIIRGGKRS